jgi:hypothetical protein
MDSRSGADSVLDIVPAILLARVISDSLSCGNQGIVKGSSLPFHEQLNHISFETAEKTLVITKLRQMLIHLWEWECLSRPYSIIGRFCFLSVLNFLQRILVFFSCIFDIPSRTRLQHPIIIIILEFCIR